MDDKEVENIMKNILKNVEVKERDIRPWGGYSTIFSGDGFKVKMLFILPKKRFSLQSHKKRSEKWIIVNGEGFVTKEDVNFFARSGDTVTIQTGEKHRLANISDKVVLTVVEVQFGKELVEDDIERFEDDWGRC